MEVIERLSLFSTFVVMTTGQFMSFVDPFPPGVTPYGDRLHHNAYFPYCYYSDIQPPTHDCRWPASLNVRIDEDILGGNIVAYRIRWFSGAWSVWFVPGVNDIDAKYNPYARPSCPVPYLARSLRRRWASFYDHYHRYLICK